MYVRRCSAPHSIFHILLESSEVMIIRTYLSLQISMSVTWAVMTVMGMQPVTTLLVAISAPVMKATLVKGAKEHV